VDPTGVWPEAAGSSDEGSAAVGGALGRPVGLGDFLLPPSSWRRRPDPIGGRCKATGSGRASGWIRRRWSVEAEAGGGACGGGLKGRMASVATPSPLLPTPGSDGGAVAALGGDSDAEGKGA
jgi:hypothetical protein